MTYLSELRESKQHLPLPLKTGQVLHWAGQDALHLGHILALPVLDIHLYAPYVGQLVRLIPVGMGVGVGVGWGGVYGVGWVGWGVWGGWGEDCVCVGDTSKGAYRTQDMYSSAVMLEISPKLKRRTFSAYPSRVHRSSTFHAPVSSTDISNSVITIGSAASMLYVAQDRNRQVKESREMRRSVRALL
jgi:hypothetical protein